MPVAVPAGEYELHASIDLGTPFGVIEDVTTVTIAPPSADILEKRLKELESEDSEVRRLALIQLRYFRSDGEKVVPALLGRLEDKDPTIRMVALSVFSAFPQQAKEHLDLFLGLLRAELGVSLSEKVQAAYLLARHAPWDEEVLAAILKAEEAGGSRRVSFSSARKQYQRRFPKEQE